MTPTTMYPYLSYRDAAAPLRFLEEAFGFTISVRWDNPRAPSSTPRRLSATVPVMGTAEHPIAPLEGASVGQGVYVEDADAHFERAQAGGARVVYPPEDTG